ncbi:MAG: AI-2E family transporter [Fusobacteriaceae bacterium]
MLQNNKKVRAGKYFTMLFVLILIQSFFQNTESFKNIFGQLMGYLMPFIYAVFFAVILQPLSSIIESKLKFKRELSIALSVLIAILFVAGIIVGIVPGVVASIKEINVRIPEFQVKLQDTITNFFHYLNSKGIVSITQDTVKSDLENMFTENKELLKNVVKALSLNFMNTVVVLGQMFIGLIIAVFFINENEYFEKFLHNVFYIFSDKEKAEEGIKFLDDSRKIFLNYLWGKAVVSAILAVIVYIMMFIGGVPYAGLIAILTMFGNMVPYVGMFIVMLLGTVFVFLESPDKLWILYTAQILGNQIEGLLLTPKIIGKTVGLGSFWVITGVLLGGAILGPIGMVLGVPVIGVLKLLYKKKLEEKCNLIQEEKAEKGE